MTTEKVDLERWFSNEGKALLECLKKRFETNTSRHETCDWPSVQKRLEDRPEKLWSLQQMERTGGEPDVVAQDSATGAFLFVDCARESPAARRSLCYDRAALDSRKKFPPQNSAQDLAREMGVSLLTEEQYLDLQKFAPIDTKTSSWLETPEAIRKRGGALFGDYRFGRVFIYHNGAESYYAARGFRASLLI
ncbi:DUF4256 domain-containing protein [Cyclobacterium xiamenense]|uniref:DUF4256 domain-containing protein n=1 Tax=Cyclobacterium xiamenense TaxID=1297121 RepID=UPI0012B8C438|nr:DUF4256 domain-containing protein [Cyclobacterium xiamenense]